jgi:hypothetical protein
MKKTIEITIRLLFLFVFVLGQTPAQSVSASSENGQANVPTIAATASIGQRLIPAAPGPAPASNYTISLPEKFKPSSSIPAKGNFKPLASAPASSYSFYDGVDAGSDPDLIVVPIAAYNLVVDSNVLSPPSYGPNAATLGAQYCNNTTSAMTDVWAYIGDYNTGVPANSTPGTYPATNPTTYASFNADFPHLASYPPTSTDYGDQSSFYALEHESGSLSDSVDASRYLGSLAAGECRTVYWLVSYPRKAMIGGSWVDVTGGVKPEDDLWVQYDLWGKVGTNYSYYTRSLTMRNEISAMANKIWPNGDNKVPDPYVEAIQQVLGWDTWTPSDPTGATQAFPGEMVTSQGIWYDFGVVGHGFDNDYDFVPDRNAWVQPIGDYTVFDPGCFNLIRTYGLLIIKLTDDTEKLVPFVDRMYFDAVDIPENNNGVVGLVFYEYIALDGVCTASLTPYQEVASGFDNEKFNADFGAGIPPLRSQEPDMTFVKSGPGTVAVNTTYTYSLTFTLPDVDSTPGNFTTITVGSPSTGRALTFYDAVPVGLMYVANSASTSATMTNYSTGSVSVTRLFSTDGGATWSTTDPGNYTSSSTSNQLIIQWLLSEGIVSPSTGSAVTGSVSFQAQIPSAFSGVLVENDACVKIYNAAETIACDDHDIPKPGDSAITGIVWKDDGTGGAAGIAGNALQDGTEAGIGTGTPVTVWLYWDNNNDGDYTDSGDLLLATTTTNDSGAYCFGGSLSGTTCTASSTAGLAPSRGDLNDDYTNIASTYDVIDNFFDINGDGVITSADDVTDVNGGLAGTTNVVNGLLDIDGDGITAGDEGDDGTITFASGTYNVRNGYIDIDGDGLYASTGYIIVVDTEDPQIPDGYGPSTPIIYTKVQLAPNTIFGDAADYSEPSNFGFVPALTLTKSVETSNMTTTPPTALVGETIKYTIALNNQIPGSGTAASACSYFSWAGTVYPTTWAGAPDGGGPSNSQFQLPNNLLGEPDGAYTYSIMKDNTDTIGVSGFNIGNLYPGGNITSVQYVIYVNERINLASGDRFFVNTYYNDTQEESVEYFGDGNWEIDNVGQTIGTIFTGSTGASYVITKTLDAGKITNRTAPNNVWRWTDFTNDLMELQLEANKGTNNGEVNVDAAGFIITTDGTCGANSSLTLNPVPLVDTFSDTYFEFVSSNPPVSSVSTTSGTTTLSWNNVGPIYPGGTVLVTVYVRTKTTGTTTATDNTATSTGTTFANGFPANSPVSDTATVQIAANSNTRTLTGRVFDDNDNDGWQTAVWAEPGTGAGQTGYDASPDAGIGYIPVDLYACYDRSTNTLITTEGTNKTCLEQGGTLGGEWRLIATTSTAPIAIIDGYLDMDNDGVTSGDADDDGTSYGCTVVNGLITAGCSSYKNFAIVSGYVDADRDGTTSGDSGDDLLIGGYSFGNLAQGYYRVFVHYEYISGSLTADVDQTATGSCAANCDSWSGTELKNLDDQAGDLDNQTAVSNINFGYNVPTGTYDIGDFLFFDWDGDGIQDSIDEPMYNVTVRLLAPDGAVIATDTTDVNGIYGFDNYPVGYYTVQVVASSLPAGVTQVTDPSEPRDYINGYYDLSGNGSIDTGGTTDDGSVGGVTVIDGRFDMNNDGSITNADDGTLLNYPVINGYMDIDRDGVTDGDADDDYTDLTVCVTCDNKDTFSLVADNLTKDFAYQPTGSGTIGDTVFTDTNGDGLKGAFETGISGVTVKLQVDLNGNGTYVTIATDTTDSSGLYLFTNLPLGSFYNYRVVLELDSANLAAIPNDAYGNDYVKTTGTLDTGPTPDIIYINATITAASPNYLDADFGFAPPASIGDMVYLDVSGNGTQDYGDPGIPGVTVTLYTFTDIGDGDNAWDSGEPYLDENGNNTRDTGESFFDKDGRYQPGETIGSSVATTKTSYLVIDGKVDINDDGVITTADDGSFEGCTITDGDVSVCSTYLGYPIVSSSVDVNRSGTITTADDIERGYYLFTGLAPNYYVVQVTPPASSTLTADPNADGAACSTVTDQMRLINSGSDTDDKGTICDSRDGLRLYNGTNYTGADFGYQYNTGFIGDTLWIDSDNDGLRDAGEAGIDNVTVRLCNDAACTSVAQTAVTDVNGEYVFYGVAAGAYYVTVDTTDTDLTSLGLTQTFEKNDGTPDNQTTVTLTTNAGVTRVSDINGSACSNCDLDVDFGYRYTGSTTISGTICFETTNNGYCGDNNTDPNGAGTGETPYTSVAVHLYKLVDNDSSGTFTSGDTTIWVGSANTSAFKIIDGQLDFDGDGVITASDDGTTLGCTVTDGALSGCTSHNGYPVVGGYIDVNRNGTGNEGSDDLEKGDYSFAGMADGQYYIIAIASPADGIDLTSTQATVNAGGDDSSANQLVETLAVDGDTASAYQTITTSGDTTIVDRDFAFQLKGSYDFGDLPQTYSTTVEGIPDGPRAQQPVGGYTIYLGTAPDTEANGQPTTAATGDGADEDGVIIHPTHAENLDGWADGVGAIQVSVTGGGWLIGWVDWNRDGDFYDTNEMVISRSVSAGANQTFTIDTLTTLTDGYFYARFRLFSAQPALPASASTGNFVNGEVEDYRWTYANGPTPVTLSYFRASANGGAVDFAWSTATETGNVGFNLYVAYGATLTRLNNQLIASRAVDSLNRQDYSYTANVSAGETFYIEEVSIQGETHMHGPFQAGQEYGSLVASEPINWASVQSQNAAERALAPDLALDVNTSAMNIKVSQSGLYRVTYEALRAAGYDLAAISPAKLQLSNRGVAVPVYMKGGSRFGPGSYFEFYGQALDTIYTAANIYKLEVISSGASRVTTFTGAPARGLVPPASFTDTLIVNNQRAYASFYALEDGWYDTSMLAYTTSKTWNFPFDVPALADPNAAATITITVWGVTDWPQSPDHHLVVSLNGVQLADELFNGLTVKNIQVNVPAGALRSGANTLQLTLPGDTGVQWDMVNFDKLSLTYQRAFQAKDGRLTFTGTSKVFKVANLPTRNVTVYRQDSKGLVRLNTVQVSASGSTYNATFAGTGASATYYVSAVESLYAPVLEAARPAANNLNQPAQYLIIAHPTFINGIQPLVQARQAQGLTVNVVDVNDIYAKYSFGVFDPQAIKQYIAYAKQNLGAQYVLLLGGDTYDYRNYLGRNSVSFIPSLYAQTSPTVKMVPVDPLYADVNGDNVPDLAIGRFPVRTVAELDLMVTKTLAYQNKDYARTAVFASDVSTSADFRNITLSMASSVPSGWSVETINLDDLEVASAQTRLLAAMNRGTALVTYTGHSGASNWTFSGLFNKDNAAALTNAGKPFVVVQWGCWNIYHIDPVNNYLVQSLLFSGDKGAVSVLGAATLTDSKSEELLGSLLTPRLVTSGKTVGQALLEAKTELAQTHPELLDVLLGWSLMGDPALVVEQ